MNKAIIARLMRFGLTRSQAVLFFAGYSAGPLVMAKLAREAGVPRSSAYYVMQELLRRGFFSTKKQGKRVFYAAASGQQLIAMARERERLVKIFLHHISKQY